jgi:hypothetical protein
MEGRLKKYLITISQIMMNIMGTMRKATNHPKLAFTQSV